MAYVDMSRVELSWAGLTTLIFGSPVAFIPFQPSEAWSILRSTPNIVHCTIHLCTPTVDQGPISRILTLAHLESLTVIGNAPPGAFAEALHLPRLTRLFAGELEASNPPEVGNTSSVFLWIEKYGTQLKEVFITHSSLTRRALGITLENLPNVESLELVWNPKNYAAPLVSGPFGLTPNKVGVLRNLDPSPKRIKGCSCPKVQALTFRVGDGDNRDTLVEIVDVIEKRKGVTRPSSVARLDKVALHFRVPSGSRILPTLRDRGVDTDGVPINY